MVLRDSGFTKINFVLIQSALDQHEINHHLLKIPPLTLNFVSLLFTNFYFKCIFWDLFYLPTEWLMTSKMSFLKLLKLLYQEAVCFDKDNLPTLIVEVCRLRHLELALVIFALQLSLCPIIHPDSRMRPTSDAIKH